MRRNSSYTTLFDRIAIEEIEEAAVPTDSEAAAAPVEENVDSLETALIEIHGEAEEILDMSDIVEEGVETDKELEVVTESLRVIAANGGLDKNGAIMLNHTLYAHYKRVGIPMRSNTVSIESFGGTQSRAATTLLAMEAIEANQKTLWEKILALIEKLKVWFKGLWNKFFDAATKLKARADNLVKAGAPAGAPTSKTFEKDSLVGALYIGSSVDVSKAADVLVKAGKESNALAVATVKTSECLLAALTAGKLSELKATVSAGVADVKKNIGDVTKVEAASVGVGVPGDGVVVFRGNVELPGGRAIILISPEDTSNVTAEQAGKISVKLADFNKAAAAPAKAQLKTLEGTAIVDVAKKISELADVVLEYKSKVATADTLAGKILAEAKKQASEQKVANPDQSVVDKTKQAATDLFKGSESRQLAKAAISIIQQPASSVIPYLLNTGKAVLDYVEVSKKQYAKAATKPATKPAEAPAA